MPSKSLRTAAALVLLVLCTKAHVMAQAATVTVSESALAFRMPHSESQQRTFRVEGKPLPKLSVVAAGDLVDEQTGLVISSRNVAVASASRDETAGVETFTITIGGATRAGHYKGKLEVRPETGAAVKLDLDVTTLPVSQVDAEVNSKNPILALQQGWLDLPWTGEWKETGKATATVPLYLLRTGGGEAQVDEVYVTGLLGPGSRELPHKAVQVVSQLPVTVSGAQAQPVELKAVADDLAPGEYKGTVAIHVQGQEALLQVPLIVRIKAGPLVPLLLLLLGILAALLFTWWNTDGMAARDLVKSLERLAADVSSGEKLQAEDRTEAARQIEAAVRDLDGGVPTAQVKPKLDALVAFLAARRAATDGLLTQSVEPLRQALDLREEMPGTAVRQALRRQVDTLRDDLTAGRFDNLSQAQGRLNRLKPQVDYFAALIDKFVEVPEARKGEVRQQMDAATTVTELRQILLDAGVQNVPASPPGMSFGAEVEAAGPSAPGLGLSLRRRLQLSLGAAAVALLTYVFVLAVGWLSLYVKSDTFGADPMSYVSLFLWGATVEAVRGKTVNLTSLKAITETR